MIQQTYKEIVTPELLKGAIENNEYHGFREDYHLVHCLMRIYNPKSIFEIGTNMGTGTKILKNAVPSAEVFSLDLPTELAHISLQHPINEGKGDSVGHKCNLPFTLLRGDSMKFDFSLNPCDAYFIDGEHDYDHPFHEAKQVLKNKPKLIIFHDSDIDVVYNAIIDAFKGNKHYDLYRVTDTRIAYAVRK
jgi:predicted O-methyltransferase YrrM